ncbi:hypothetical protein EBL89_13525 [Cereibacter sphaeroides]|uniref:hypothetical protein n=1 Tax=Cereibacter sphaeroides TaxID=1063 RepID=UPI000F534541|nr:hypothetical protein [Cereibacter sphaeroides]AZB56274.1 hypothetical protein EBL89_13525 [Cereibacter sphaeroides]AZB60531.1 hypothetical protein EBL88_13405 [Cereibacter sphaeroides]
MLGRQLDMLDGFVRAEDGAVTVDWIVLTAAIIGLCLLVTIPAYTSSSGVAQALAARLVEIVTSLSAP